MEQKFKFSKSPLISKIVYGAVIAMLCITAIIVGIVAANQNANEVPDNTPPVTDQTPDTNPPAENPPSEDNTKKELVFVSPLESGKIIKNHSATVPVFSLTLGEWRIHHGIDIMSEPEAGVFASEDGEISAVYNDPKYGVSVEITHEGDIKTIYSNLKNDLGVKVGDKVKKGDAIGTVGDTATSEIAEEPHLHFEVLVKDVSVNPLDYISEQSKETSLGIENNKADKV